MIGKTGELLLRGLHAQWRSAIGWTLGIVALAVMVGATWPTIRDSGMIAAFEQLDPRFLEAFGAADFMTPAGYLDGQLYALLLPLVLAGMAIAATSALTAGDEEAGRLEFVAALPLSRRHLLLTRFAAVLVVLTGLAALTVLTIRGMREPFDLDVPFSRLVSATAGCLLLVVVGTLEDYGTDAIVVPVDPGAEASLGGMASTNASGTMAVKYGVTSDQVMGLEVVMADGTVIRTGGRYRKSSSGYQLTRLFCGAEGTLGIITELTVRLTPRPAHVVGVRASFANVHHCVAYVSELIRSGLGVARCELVDSASIRAINDHLGLTLETSPTVFLEFHGDASTTEDSVATAVELAREHGCEAPVAAHDGQALAQLWRARHQAYYCQLAAHPGMRNLITDLAVPVSRLAELVDTSTELLAGTGLPHYLLGHVGDGNFHITLFFAADDAAAEERVHDVYSRLIEATLRAGGTSTGEHGIGFRKLPYVRAEHGAAVEVMWAMKRALDPHGILNPGKKLPLGS